MTDRDAEFQGELRAWFRSEVTAELAAPASLRTAMAAIPATVPAHAGYPRWMLLMVATAALVVMASAAAIGSGLIRLPETRPDPLPIGGRCTLKLDDALLLEASLFVSYGGGGYFAEAGYFVYRDGLVLVRESRNGAPVYPLVRQRRLTAEGMDSLLAAATRPGLEGCRHVSLGDDTRHVTFLVRDGSSVNVLDIGSSDSPADAEAASTTAAAEMVRRVTDADLGVPPDQWADDAWTEYVPDSYRVTVSFYDVPGNEFPHEIWDHLLSDGSTLRTIGQSAEAPPNYGFQAMRCVEMNAAEVRSLREDLTTLLGPSDVGRGQYAGFHAQMTGTSSEYGRGGGAIDADYTLPHEGLCTEASPDESLPD
jgi:hypothetical protein